MTICGCKSFLNWIISILSIKLIDWGRCFLNPHKIFSKKRNAASIKPGNEIKQANREKRVEYLSRFCCQLYSKRYFFNLYNASAFNFLTMKQHTFNFQIFFINNEIELDSVNQSDTLNLSAFSIFSNVKTQI